MIHISSLASNFHTSFWNYQTFYPDSSLSCWQAAGVLVLWCWGFGAALYIILLPATLSLLQTTPMKDGRELLKFGPFPYRANPVTRVSDMSGGRVDLIWNKLLPPSDAGKFMTAVTAMYRAEDKEGNEPHFQSHWQGIYFDYLIFVIYFSSIFHNPDDWFKWGGLYSVWSIMESTALLWSREIQQNSMKSKKIIGFNTSKDLHSPSFKIA